MSSKSTLIESIRKRQGFTIKTLAPSTSVPVYILRCRLAKRLRILTTIHMEDEIDQEEMTYRLLTRCDKAHKDKEYFLVFLEEHTDLDTLFDQTPAAVFFEFQRWKKIYIDLDQAA